MSTNSGNKLRHFLASATAHLAVDGARVAQSCVTHKRHLPSHLARVDIAMYIGLPAPQRWARHHRSNESGSQYAQNSN